MVKQMTMIKAQKSTRNILLKLRRSYSFSSIDAVIIALIRYYKLTKEEKISDKTLNKLLERIT